MINSGASGPEFFCAKNEHFICLLQAAFNTQRVSARQGIFTILHNSILKHKQ